MASQSAPLTERKYVLPFVLVTSLFFLWSIGVNLNDVLIPHLKKAFDLSDFQSSFIQIAFFGGYFLAAFPAGRLMETRGLPVMTLGKRTIAESIGTFWLVFGGCGSAVLAAGNW